MKKLLTLLFAAMGLTAMADNTVTVKYDFENYKLDSKGKYYEWFEKNADDTENNLWATGNAGFAMTAGNAPAADYPSVAIAEGYDGACVKLETKSTGFLGGLVKMPIAAGNLFIGSFDSSAAMSSAMKATNFGKVFDKKPLKFFGYYKYKAGEKVTDKNGKEIAGKVDKGQIYSVLYKNKDAQGNDVVLNGADVLTNENIVAIADAGEITDVAEWTKFEVAFDYKENVIDEEILKAGGYSLTVVFTSSVEGASFIGAVGSTLYVDKVELVCEGEESSAKEFTDKLVVQLGDGEPMDPLSASIFVTDNGDGKYTLTLPNFMLGEGPEAMSVGTINLENVEGTEEDGVVVLSTKQTITIAPGDDESIGWIGPGLGPLPVTLYAEMKGEKLFAKITISWVFDIFVTFGEKISTGIDCIVPGVVEQPTSVYTLDGKKAATMQPGNVYIIRKADGKTVKVIK